MVDTTVQEKATDARLAHRAIEKLVDAKRDGVELRQSYRRVAKRDAIMIGRSAATRMRISSNARGGS